MPREINNMAASVHDRLLNSSRASGRPFQEMLEYYAMERFLYRLSVSPHTRRFVLKGGLMLPIWGAAVSRPTRDIDLLGHTANEVTAITRIVQEICRQQVADDGIVFDEASCRGEMINPEKEYTGVRVRFTAHLGQARIPMQVDVGFGDVVIPEAAEAEYPVMLEHPPPKVRGYTRESVIAEKLEAMVKRGEITSRTKDFLDIWLLSRQYEFSGEVLAEAIQTTFENRDTPIRPDPVCLTEEFAATQERQEAWQALLATSRITDAPGDFPDIVEVIRAFLKPVLGAIASSRPFVAHWVPPGPWQVKG